jgi:hypothetical protein
MLFLRAFRVQRLCLYYAGGGLGGGRDDDGINRWQLGTNQSQAMLSRSCWAPHTCMQPLPCGLHSTLQQSPITCTWQAVWSFIYIYISNLLQSTVLLARHAPAVTLAAGAGWILCSSIWLGRDDGCETDRTVAAAAHGLRHHRSPTGYRTRLMRRRARAADRWLPATHARMA